MEAVIYTLLGATVIIVFWVWMFFRLVRYLNRPRRR